MPELPEVETVRRGLLRIMVGQRVERACLVRTDFCVTEHGGPPRPQELLQGAVVTDVVRHGKQLAIVADSGRVLRLHLGMSGQVRGASGLDLATLTHVHAWWRLGRPAAPRRTPGHPGLVLFRDPRRFGGLWTHASMDAVRAGPWAALGPDALSVTTPQMARGLAGSRRAVKAALLDQAVLAGVGNIYADEALFRARIAPARQSGRLTATEVVRLATSIRAVLRHAIAARGSTLRDYVDAEGKPGRSQLRHLVYGRAGMPCPGCGRRLTSREIAQRTTVFCTHCQRRS
ncbi:MAG: bifunctional DNA-formamidopyrimidine glycosylase/DNA-(apurinic or apyrimidinic site) lyase [Phycisphaerales bacterium]|nr:bifunctional DNA-formamidopyrimidine glycosylase/DNA-(apurinic or apyrimidinic site) lyase [Phycisphaerales bacterium]